MRHKNVETAESIVSKIKEMDPESAFEYLDQLPNFLKYANDIVKYFYDICDTSLQNSKRYTINSLILIIDDLDRELKSGDRSYEAKCEIIDKMIEVSKLISKEESKQAIERLGWFTALGLVVSLVFRGIVKVFKLYIRSRS